VLGKEVATLLDEYKPVGSYEIEFSAKGGPASGIYFYQLKATPNGGQAGNYFETKKMIRIT